MSTCRTCRPVELRGFRASRLGYRHRSEPVCAPQDPRGRPVYWVGPAGAEQDAGPGTDFDAVAQGFVSVTPLQVDLTRHTALTGAVRAAGWRVSMTDRRLAGIGMTSARTRDRLVQRLREQGIANLAVLDRIRNVPRHIFVDEALGSRAYEDTALPIGFGQTISQPYIVARMTEALLEGGTLDNVLEVGTGCGYQTAVLAPLVTRVSTIERIEPLLARARERLKELGVRNVRFRHGDGTLGWKAQGALRRDPGGGGAAHRTRGAHPAAAGRGAAPGATGTGR